VLDAGGGGGGSSVGSYSGLIAAAAAKAELMHLGWDSTGDYSVRREVETHGSPSDPVDYRVSVEVNTYSGAYTSTAEGPSADLMRDHWVDQATGVVEKWGPKIDGLFTRWKDLPSRYTSAPLLDWGVRELNVDPDNLTSTGDAAGGVNTRLAGDLERLKTRTSQLRGHYAVTFADYYVAQLPTTVQAQGLLLSALAVASRAQGEVWGRTQDDLSTFESNALAAMKDSGPSGGPNSGLVMALTVVAALGTALAAVPSLGGSVALFGAISGAATIGAAVEAAQSADESFEDLPLGADHPDKVFTHMDDALKALDAEIEKQEAGIRDFLVAAKAFADGRHCELTRPSLNSAPANEVFSEVTVDPSIIGQITELWLPSIAADLREAERRLDVTADDGFRRATDVGLAPTGAWPQFSALQTRTSELLTGLSKDLEDAGTKLEEAARLIGMSDEEINQRYRGIERQVEDRNLNHPDDVVALL